MAETLPPAVLDLIVNTAEWIAGLEEAIAALQEFDVALEETTANLAAFSEETSAAMESAAAVAEGSMTDLSAALDEAAVAYDRLGEAADMAAASVDASAAATAEAGAKSAASSEEMGAAGLGASADLEKAGLALAAVGTGSLFAAGDFQKAMTQLVTSAGESSKAISFVGQGVQDMADQVGFGAIQLAKSLYPIDSAGYHAADSLTVLKAAAQGAKDENADLYTVANALTTVMKDYQIPVDQSADAMSKLVTAVSFGKTNLQAMSTAMANLLPVASSAHLQFSDVVSVLAEMTSKGTTAQKAALDIGAAIKSLEAPTGAMIKQFGEFGITALQVQQHLAQDGLGGTLNWLQGIAEKSAASMGETVTGAMKKLIGTSPGLQAMLEESGSSFNDVQKAMDAVNHSMADAQGNVIGFSEVQGNLNFTFDQFKAELENTAIALGNVMMPAAIQLFKVLQNGFADMAKNTDIGDAFKGMVDTITKSFEALAPVFGPLAAASKDLVTVLGSLLVDSLKVLAPMLAVVLTALDDLLKAIEPLLPAIQKIAEEMGQVWGQAFKQILDAITPLLPALTVFLKTILQELVRLIPIIAPAVLQMAKAFEDMIPALAPLIPVFTNLIKNILPMVELTAYLTAGLIALTAMGLEPVVKGFSEWIVGASQMGQLLDSMPQKFESFSEMMGRGILSVPDQFSAAFRQAGAIMNNLWNQAMDGLKREAQDSVTATVETFTNLPQKLAFALGRVIDIVVRASGDIGRGLWKGVVDGATAVVQFFDVDLPKRIQSAESDAGTWLNTTGKNIIKGLLDGVASVMGNVELWFNNLPNQIKGWVADAGTWLAKAGSDLIQGLVNGILKKLGDVVNAMTGGGGSVKGNVTTPFNNSGSWLNFAGADIVHGLISGILSTGSWLQQKIYSFAKSVVDSFLAAFGIHSPSQVMADSVGQHLTTGIAQGMLDAMPAIHSAVGSIRSILTGAAGLGITPSIALPAGLNTMPGAAGGNVLVINNNIGGSVVAGQEVQQLVQTQTLRYQNRNPTNGLSLFGRGRS